MDNLSNWLLKALFLITLLPFMLSEHLQQNTALNFNRYSQDSVFSKGVKIAELENKEIDEASGLVFSRRHPNRIYTHNDSGGEPVVYVLDEQGKSVSEILLKDTKNRDWEDIAIGPGPLKETSYVYVGEIGDNNAQYASVKLFRFPEPKSLDLDQSVEVETWELTYPDGARDAETLMVDPWNGDIYILSKRDSANTLYKMAAEDFGKADVQMQEVMRLPFTMSVAGDISANGKQILIKNYWTVFYWERNEGEPVEEALKRKPIQLPYNPEPQGEAIGFHPDGNAFFTLSEKRFNIEPVLYRYEKKP
ncbi:hypothetical protein [Pararhodonellum marinum]|uniref:hypothetical protein n=1 Tax=Pararhodonellum marinum TaxID=2755358 RepID=UPI00188F5E5E|nr:hypothetical protein [Pararhodonellum marinum]